MNRFTIALFTICFGFLFPAANSGLCNDAFAAQANSDFNSHTYEIGHCSVNWFDPDRGDRAIPTEIYYPADEEGADVPAADPGGVPFPVIAFGHGRMMAWDAYVRYWTALVPQGYIVVCPRTEMTSWPNKVNFSRDLLFAIAKMRSEGAEPASTFYGKVGETSSVMGHSLGGVVTFMAALEDPTVTAIATFACGMAPEDDLPGIVAPALLFGGSDDELTPMDAFQIPFYEALGSERKTLIGITGANHCQYAEYTDACDPMEPDPPGISREEQLALTSVFLIPWLDFTLKGETEAWNDFMDLLTESDRIAYFHQEPPTPSPTPTTVPTASPTASPTAAPNPHSGDVDGDGSITPGDSYKALRIYLGMDPPDADWTAADFCPRPNGDGVVDPGDAYGIVKKYLGYSNPCS